VSLVKPPRLVEDPDWERAVLGPFVDEARVALMRQLETGVAEIDVDSTRRRAYRSVSFYQRRFADLALGIDELDAAPPTRRTDLALGVEHFLAHPLEPWALQRGWLGKTSGSTGEPVTYLRDPRTLAWFWAFVDFALAYAGRKPFPRGGTIALLDAIAHMPEYGAFLPLLHDGRFEKRSDARGLSAHVITGDPESLAVLAEIDLPSPPELVLSSAFAMPRPLMKAIAERTGAAVIEYYASQETSIMGIGCRLGRGFHALSGACAIEELDGEIVATPTNNPSFVLIRYAPGDLGSVRATECACGLSGPTVVELAGRTNVRFDARVGTYAAGLVGPLLSRLDVLEHRLVQHARDRYVLVHRGKELSPDALVPLKTRLAELAGGPVELEVKRVETIPRDKAKPEPFVRLP
jgi:phenylacetate-coenzyme A ligase PaaK-like adenylate-forming protein